jgi:hypothetical protein
MGNKIFARNLKLKCRILLANGLASKFRRQHGRHFRQGIESGDERPHLLAMLQPAVDLFLDGLGEASDFTFGSCVHNFYGLI